MLGSGEDIGRDDLVQQAGKFAIGEAHTVQGLKLFAEIMLKCGAVSDVFPVLVFKPNQCANEALFDLLFNHCWCLAILIPSLVTQHTGKSPQLAAFVNPLIALPLNFLLGKVRYL